MNPNTNVTPFNPNATSTLPPVSNQLDPNASATNTNAPIGKTKRDSQPTLMIDPNAASSVALVTTTVPDLTSPQYIQSCVTQLRAGDTKETWDAFDALRDQNSATPIQERAQTLVTWISAIGADPAAIAKMNEDPAFFALMLQVAADLTIIPEAGTLGTAGTWLGDILKAIGRQPEVAESLLLRTWTDPEGAVDVVLRWIVDSVGIARLNDKDAGLGCRLVNLLWHAKQFTMICDLIKADLNTRLSARGEGVPSREGVYSGYIQPLEHMLGPYLRLVHLHANAANPTESAQVEQQIKEAKLTLENVLGAAAIFKVLGGNPKRSIVTTYQEVLDSELINIFADHPGTIWGFEHVRQPFVEAAHATKVGQQPIRMWEMWEAVQWALNETAYNNLFQHPNWTINNLVEYGVKEVEKGFIERPHEYIGRNTAEFVKQFEIQCTEYLKVFASRSPGAKFATSAVRGLELDKWMGGLGCKAGLWWAEKEKDTRPVYYCLDGLDIQDVINYKTFKTKAINAIMEGTSDKPFEEVITLVEMREILKNWGTLKDVVKFVRNGHILKGAELDEVDTWIKQMEAQRNALQRKSPSKDGFRTRLDQLHPDLFDSVQDDAEALKIVSRSEMLLIAAKAEHEVVSLCLKDCAALFDCGLLKRGFDVAYTAMVNEKDLNERLRMAQELKDVYLPARYVMPHLRDPLVQAIDRFAQTGRK